MDETIVFEKTERGQREIAHGGGELQPKFRRILIMIDGEKPIGALAPLARPGELELIAEGLLRGGYIVATGNTAVAGGESPEEEAPLADNERVAFEATRSRAMREVQDLLGPHGDPLAIEIERCGSPAQLRELIAKSHAVIGKVLGSARAEVFRQKLVF